MAQLRSAAGRVGENVDEHVRLARRAASAHAGLIVFPELSVTGYEPGLARELAMESSDPRLEPIRSAAAELRLAIAVGIPLRSVGLPQIGLATFHADGSHQLYAKQRLHADELPFFSAGAGQVVLDVGGTRISPGICYETRFDESYERAKALGADVYVASAAKPAENIEAAHAHYAQASRGHAILTALCNCVGLFDTFVGCGRSAAWGRDGELLAELDDESNGLLLVDTSESTAECVQLERGDG